MTRFLPLLLLASALSAAPIDDATFAAVLVIGYAHGVPRSVTQALVTEESGGDATARSRPTAEGYCSRGLVQLYTRPDNLAYLLENHWPGDPACFDIDDPRYNATVGLGYLAELHERYGNWFQALLFYNCGRVRNAPESTRLYAKRIVNAR